MEQKHRKRIDLLCDLIVRQVDIKALWPYLFMNGIFNYDDCNVPNWSQNITNPETIKDIIFNHTNKRALCILGFTMKLTKKLHFFLYSSRKVLTWELNLYQGLQSL